MVSKLTLLEPHFDGAQFGPKSIDTDQFGEREGTKGANPREDAEAPGGTSWLRTVGQGVIGFVLVGIVLYAVLRLAASEDD